MPLSNDNLISLIREAFADVRKGKGVGMRESAALDYESSGPRVDAARAADVEQCWWEVPAEVLNPSALAFTDSEGRLFLMPILMTAALRGNDIAENDVMCELLGTPGSVAEAKKLVAEDIAAAIGFDARQKHAAGKFVELVQHRFSFYPSETEEEALESAARMHDHHVKNPEKSFGKHKILLEDALTMCREKCRLIREWLTF